MATERFQIHIITNDASDALAQLRAQIAFIAYTRKRDRIFARAKAFVRDVIAWLMEGFCPTWRVHILFRGKWMPLIGRYHSIWKANEALWNIRDQAGPLHANEFILERES